MSPDCTDSVKQNSAARSFIADCETVQRSLACLTCCSSIPDLFPEVWESKGDGEDEGGEGRAKAALFSLITDDLSLVGAVLRGSSMARAISLVMAQTKWSMYSRTGSMAGWNPFGGSGCSSGAASVVAAATADGGNFARMRAVSTQ